MKNNKRKKFAILSCFLALIGLIRPVTAIIADSLGEEGIYARQLHQEPYNLTGRKIAIGQVEIGRPAQFGFDKAASWNPPYRLAGVFYRNQLAKSNNNIENHSAMVASLMVSQDKLLPGVAPDAKLYASAVGALKRNGQPEECLASQYVAQQNSDDVRAINLSFGEPLIRDSREKPVLDGNALLTQCLDWSARVHDVLYVIAGNQGSGGIPIPTDNYNGITTAYTTKRQGLYTKVDFSNLSNFPQGVGKRVIKREINLGQRRAISLLAPGSKINLYTLEGKKTEATGTSFAAPHITASVALLQEGGDRYLFADAAHWSLDYRRHEVMKAVLLNSAEKIKDQGNGLLLGMTRTIFGEDNHTWLQSDAYSDNKIPLDIEMGTGQLNVLRAYQQFSAGQWTPEAPVDVLGWDYRPVKTGNYQDYVLNKPLQKASFISITLAWDRLVELNDANNNQQYDQGENFSDRGLNNLDIYLLPINTNNNSKSVCSSVSEFDSVEHIFCPIPQSGRYKIRVQYHQQVNQETQPYALAWWAVPIP